MIGQKGDWIDGSMLETGGETSQALRLPAGGWNLSLQYFSPFDLTLSAPGFREELKAALDGQRPNTISLGNNGQFWPAGRFESDGGPVSFTLRAAEASALQSLTGYDGKAYVGELVAVPAEPHRTVPLRQACDQLDRLVRSGRSALELPGQAALEALRSGLTRTTSQTSPTFSSPLMTRDEMSTCHQRRPWVAEVGKAWWLLW